ncbi:ATP-binding protein [Adlercreutzia sp. R7]|uniref:histidine kinase n=1 Tax=Adlercreutzia wanghongyangiae TaxID=3111451 RepID=A0ABU6IFB8_9ACTN|nr:ATP-binding protein [Adlercreutzia sp. R7]
MSAPSRSAAAGAPSLSGRIFRSVLLFTLMGIASLTLLFVSIFAAAVRQMPGSRDAMADFFAGDLAVCVLATLIVGVVLAFAVSRLLTRYIMRPLDEVDVADPLAGRAYAEMAPLLTRIDSQQRTLRAQNEELARAESLRRDFSANVSHEMKTPLQVISGYAELMANGMVPPDDVPRFAGLIYQESQAMRALINDVLILSRLDEVPPDEATAAPVEVLGVACRAADRLAKLAEEHGIAVEVVGEPATVAGNESLMEQMLYNLIENAIRYNESGGQVRVEVSVGKPSGGAGVGPLGSDEPRAGVESRAVEGSVGQSANALPIMVRVSDNGPGIPEDQREKIFERFYRLEKSRSKETGGTGLGLAIVKHGAQRHGGTIEVGGTEGHGATFTLRFPAAVGNPGHRTSIAHSPHR